MSTDGRDPHGHWAGRRCNQRRPGRRSPPRVSDRAGHHPHPPGSVTGSSPPRSRFARRRGHRRRVAHVRRPPARRRVAGSQQPRRVLSSNSEDDRPRGSSYRPTRIHQRACNDRGDSGDQQRPLRRHHHRDRRRRRHARPHAGRVGEADPAARARKLPAAGDPELGTQGRVPRRPLHFARHLVRRRRHAVPAAGPLLRRRRDQALRRGAVPAASAGLRRARTTSTASPRPGRSATTTSSRGTPRPSGCIRSTATTARTRPRATGRKQYPWPAVSHEPRIQELSDDLAAARLPPVPRAVRHPARRGRPGAQHLHPLHLVRRLPVPGARQVRRRDDRGPPAARPRRT